MKTLDIASKDLKHIFQSVFSLVMMFGAPLLITGLLYFAFGGLGSGNGGYHMPVTKVQIVNLDRPDAAMGFAAGQLLVDFLQDPSLSEVLAVSLAADEASARLAVDEQRAGVAVIIPPDFTLAATAPQRTTAVSLYADPTLTIGPGIVKDLISHFMDGFSGAKIAGQVASAGQADPAVQARVSQQYTAWLQAHGHASEGQAAPRLSIVSPAGEAPVKKQGAEIVGPIMAGMLVFFVFFMGANGAESIIKEDEQGTLARLFNTPTQLFAIFGGKFLGVVVSLSIQIILLLLASALLFGIQWGRPATVALVSASLVVASAGFGVLLMSFIKNSRQTGPVMGGVMALTGMLGGLFTPGVPNLQASFEQLSLVTPQGWALQGWQLALSGAGVRPALFPCLVTAGLGLAFLAVGAAVFRKRFR
jgi:ABC-type multidrug transport system permease subunit